MERKFVWKLIFVVLLVAAACVGSLTTIEKLGGGAKDTSSLPEFLWKTFPGISPGLDIQGGLRLSYEVEVDVAIEDRRDRVAKSLVRTFKDEAEMTVDFRRGEEPHLFELVFTSESDRASDDVKGIFAKFAESAKLESEEGTVSHMALDQGLIDYTTEISVKQAQEKIDTRIDELGLENTSVSASDMDIIVEIPTKKRGEEEGNDEEALKKRVKRVKNIASGAGSLELKSDEAIEDRGKTFYRLVYVAESEVAVSESRAKILDGIRDASLENVRTVVKGTELIVSVREDEDDDERVARIKRIISTTAHLEFKMVDYAGSGSFFLGIKDKIDPDGPIKLKKEQKQDGVDNFVADYYLEAKDEPEGKSGRLILREFLKTIEVPEDRTIGFHKNVVLDEMGNPTAEIKWRTYYLERSTGLTGDYVENAAVLQDQQDQRPYVSLEFNQIGAKKFEELTGANVKRHMAIQLDDTVQSDPIIEDRIGGGQCRITLGSYRGFNELWQEAQDLVVVLRAGSLPAPIRMINDTWIGPALGRDSVAMGTLALEVAFIAILIFMLVYYKGGGVAADIALIVNTVLIVGIMSTVGATLTLPGIAGIILTIGMAVDANVIIYERIREELKAGKSPKAAVDAGYKRAFWTIFDAQITTFIAGVVMLQYGEKDIKGFAVTLLIGILTSMFSAIFVSRICFDFMTRKRAESLSI